MNNWQLKICSFTATWHWDIMRPLSFLGPIGPFYEECYHLYQSYYAPIFSKEPPSPKVRFLRRLFALFLSTSYNHPVIFRGGITVKVVNMPNASFLYRNPNKWSYKKNPCGVYYKGHSEFSLWRLELSKLEIFHPLSWQMSCAARKMMAWVIWACQPLMPGLWWDIESRTSIRVQASCPVPEPRSELAHL